eukprot:TRINITY_DN91159_c0_g1_i1.p1 TRINITY_DN91159_c0_g1~~TRINITY_DN91159_c0_g1_i1.p1  ORF type:complete len:180 (+),score=22.30 TRINITY_DN91159_c0_g1_i1:70-609(+)
MGGISSLIAKLNNNPAMNPFMGHAALSQAKIGTAVAYHQAAYTQELAKHASQAAMEMEETSRAIQRYILGDATTTITDVEPIAGQLENGGPPQYSTYGYPLADDHWPTSYPVPGPPKYPALPQPVSRASAPPETAALISGVPAAAPQPPSPPSLADVLDAGEVVRFGRRDARSAGAAFL